MTTFIADDKAVIRDGKLTKFEVDITTPVPADVWAFHLRPDNTLVIEYRGDIPNEVTTVIPTWVTDLVVEADAEDDRQKAAYEAELYALHNTWDYVRRVRDGRLEQTDWTQASDAPLTSFQKASWAAYRQALRDVTEQAVEPIDVRWPTPPQ